MSVRWVRLVVVAALGAAISLSGGLSGGTVARADAPQSIVDGGNAEAVARGTTAGIALLDRVTGRYTENGGNAHLRFGSASVVKLFIADSVLRRAGGLAAADRDWLVGQLRASTARGTDGVYQWFGLHDALPREPVIG